MKIGSSAMFSLTPLLRILAMFLTHYLSNHYFFACREKLWHQSIINPRRACAARVTVVGSVCLSAQHLTSRASFRPENHITYSTGNEGQHNCVDFSETAPLQRYGYTRSAIFYSAENAHAYELDRVARSNCSVSVL